MPPRFNEAYSSGLAACGSTREPVFPTVFKTDVSYPRDANGGFDPHVLPPSPEVALDLNYFGFSAVPSNRAGTASRFHEAKRRGNA